MGQYLTKFQDKQQWLIFLKIARLIFQEKIKHKTIIACIDFLQESTQENNLIF